jgi:hypothetical protein
MRKKTNNKHNFSSKEDEEEDEDTRMSKVASVAVSADSIWAFAADPLTISGGNPAKIIKGEMAKPRQTGEGSEKPKKPKGKKAKTETEMRQRSNDKKD